MVLTLEKLGKEWHLKIKQNSIVSRQLLKDMKQPSVFPHFGEKHLGCAFLGWLKEYCKKTGLSSVLVVGFLKEWHILPPHFLVHICRYSCIKLIFFSGKEMQLSKNQIAVNTYSSPFKWEVAYLTITVLITIQKWI